MNIAKLLILDDFGLQSIIHPVKLLLLQILEDRYERAATAIVSQLPVGKWHTYLDEPTIADAILDRNVPKAHRIELKVCIPVGLTPLFRKGLTP
jgi:DNA replication protein DnaC